MRKRHWHATECGIFCLSKAKHIKLYSVLIWKNGGYCWISNDEEILTGWPSVFTGSFHCEAGFPGPMYVNIGADYGIVPAVTITWMEDD